MAKGEAEITVRVKNEYIQVVEGSPYCLFVMKLDKPAPSDHVKAMGDKIEAELKLRYPGSRLIILPDFVASIRHLNEEDLNKAGYFRKED